MQSTFTADQFSTLKGKPVYDESGEKIGKVEDFYCNQSTGEAEWLGIGSGIFGTKHVLVPAQGIQPTNDRVTVGYAKDLVKDSPDIDEDELSEAHEQELYEHYGLRHQASRGAQTPSPRPSGSRESRDGQSMTRSEEELQIGKREADSGQVRLRKWVESRPVSEQVTLRQETARIEREPIDRPVSGAQLGEQEIEMTLRREEPVVEKRTVEKERVSLRKETSERRERVQDEVRTEQVDATDATDGGHDYRQSGEHHR